MKIDNLERRYIPAELTTEEDGNRATGYAAKFGVLSHILWDNKAKTQFREVIRPGAFSEALKQVDCTINVDHDDARLLGRTTSGTLRLSEDTVGLRFEVDLPDTSTGRDIRELLKRGDISQCSFAFSVEEELLRQEDVVVRELVKIRGVYDVSLVVRAAYPNTEVALRSIENWQKENQPDLTNLRKAEYIHYLNLLK